MHEHITTNQHNPTQKLHKKSQKPQKGFKNPKLKSKNAWMHEKEVIENTYQEIEAWTRPNLEWEECFE